MLKSIDPLLGPDVLHSLAAMGHADALVIVDRNFPAESVARDTVIGKCLRIDADGPRVARAVLSLMPLDTYAEQAAVRMEVIGEPDEVPPVQAEIQKEIDRAEGRHWPLAGLERFAFYERARGAFCLIRTSEPRAYGCVILLKGVIPPSS